MSPLPNSRRTVWLSRSGAREQAYFRLGASDDLLHRPDVGSRQQTTFRFEAANYILQHFTKVGIHAKRVIAMDSRNEIGALAHVSLVFFAPFHLLVVLIACLPHVALLSSSARA